MKIARMFFWGIALLACVMTPCEFALGAEPPPQQRLLRTRTVFSATRRFVVTGLPADRATELAQWAEGVADRMAAALGAIPFDLAQPLQIESGTGPNIEPLIRVAQGCRDGEIRQTLTLRGLDALDIEQAEEALGGLLINRYAQAMQDATARCLEPAHVPDWLAIGLIHRSRSDLRRRDQTVAFERWNVGELLSFPALIESFVMPPGRWPQKADAMLLVDWLMAGPREKDLLLDALRLQANGYPPDAGWWAKQIVGQADPARAERAWDLWIAEQRARARASTFGDVQNLLGMNFIKRYDLESAGGPAELSDEPLSSLISHRGEPWTRSFSVRLALRFRLESIGQEDEAVAVAEGYARFLDQTAKGAAARKLRKLWKEAEERRIAFETVVATRRRYLDVVEDRLRPGAGGPSAVQRYLDSVEQRLTTP